MRGPLGETYGKGGRPELPTQPETMTVTQLQRTLGELGVVGMTVIVAGSQYSVTLVTVAEDRDSDGRGATMLDALRDAIARLGGIGNA